MLNVNSLYDLAIRNPTFPVKFLNIPPQGRIFWTDTLVDAIFTSYISSNVSTAIVEQGLQTPDGIAYDWVTDTVYWTDMGTKMIG